MDKINLGETNLKIAPIIFGGNVFGFTINENESFEMLDAVTDLGINCIDTADVYSRWADGNNGGESETIIGNWMKARKNRENVIICTKVGMDVGQGNVDISEKHILKSIDLSLKRLQTDYVDLYYSHKDDEKTPPEETLSAFEKLIKSGKVRHIGASNFSAERLIASLKISKQENLPKYSVFQPEYNLLVRNAYEGKIEKTCMEYNLGVATYFALASGFLTGKYKNDADFAKNTRGDMVKEYNTEKGNIILKLLKEIAKEYNTSQAAVALAWVMQRPSISAPIASATKKEHLQAFVDASKIKLTAKQMNNLNTASR